MRDRLLRHPGKTIAIESTDKKVAIAPFMLPAHFAGFGLAGCTLTKSTICKTG
jgi:hypothetical protein